MVHIYAAQYFWVMSYWLCPTDCVWSKFLSDEKLGTLRNISWNFESNPSSHYKGVVQKRFWSRPTDRVWCKTRDLKKHFLKSWAQYFFVTSCLLCPNDRVRSKFLSDAKLGTLNFLPNPSSHCKGVVRKNFCFALQTKKFNIFDRQMDEKNMQI